MELKERIYKNWNDCAKLRLHVYHSGKEIIRAIKIIKFALIFLDIKMKDMNGEKIAEYIRKEDDEVILIFNTSYADPTPHSIEAQPFRYMKKNMPDIEKNRYIMDALRKMVAATNIPSIKAKYKSNTVYLKPYDIIYAEKYNKITRAYLSKQAIKKYDIPENQEIRILDKLENVYSILIHYGFGYPHNSYIINFKYLISCTNKEFKLEEYETMVFKLTRSKSTEFKQLMRHYMSLNYEDSRKHDI